MLKNSLVNFFKNTRKRKCGDVAECKAAKQKRQFMKLPKGNNTANMSIYTNIWGVKNFNPDIPVGEDDRTMEVYRQRLLKQFHLLPYSRKQSVVQLSMDKTFPARRKDILELRKSVTEIMDEYPILADPVQIVEEFKRLTEIDIVVRWSHYFNTSTTKKVLQMKPPKSFRIDTVMDEIESISVEAESGYADLACILLTSLLREDGTLFFSVFGGRNFPQIECDSKLKTLVGSVSCENYKILVDGQVVAQTQDFICFSRISCVFLPF